MSFGADALYSVADQPLSDPLKWSTSDVSFTSASFWVRGRGGGKMYYRRTLAVRSIDNCRVPKSPSSFLNAVPRADPNPYQDC